MSKTDKILILGGTGLLGSTLTPYLRLRGHNVVTHARSDSSADYVFDLNDYAVSHRLLTKIVPTIIINLVGLTSVDACQQNMHSGYLANTHTVETIAGWIKKASRPCYLIQISTDHLYDGQGPHRESDITLMNNYAITKYAGEIAASQVACSILRTTFVGRSQVKNRESLTDWLYSSLTTGKRVQVLSDVMFNPLSMRTLVQMIELALIKKSVGVYNLGSNHGMSKADFNFEFANKLGLPRELMTRVTSSDVSFLKAYRPKDMRMDCSKFENLFAIQLPTLAEEISKAADDYYE